MKDLSLQRNKEPIPISHQINLSEMPLFDDSLIFLRLLRVYIRQNSLDLLKTTKFIHQI